MGVIIRQSIKGTIVTYVGAFIGFLTTMFVVTKYLLPEDIGLTRVVLEIGTIFGLLAQMGTSSSAIRFFPYFKDKDKHHNGFFFYLMLLPLMGCIIIIALYLILQAPITAFFVEKSGLLIDYYYWIIPLIVFMAYLLVFETYSNINMRIVVPRLNREVTIRALTLVVYLLYGYQLMNRNGLVAGTIIVYGLALLFMIVYVTRTNQVSLRRNVSFLTKPLRNDIVKYTAFLVAGSLGGTILGKLDLFMISSEMGLDFAGIYTIAFYIAAVIEIPSRSISAISSPVAAHALKENDLVTVNKLYRKVSLHQLMAGGFIFILIWINIDNIFAIIPNGAIYAEGKWVVFFIGMAKLIMVTFNFGGTMISFSKYYYWSLYFTFFIIVLGVVTNYWLIPLMGISGAAIATLITYALSYGAQQWIVLKKIKGNPYTISTLKLLIVFLVLIGINYFLVTFENPWADGIFRTALIAILGMALLYIMKISEEANQTVKTLVRKIKGWRNEKDNS